MVVELRAETLGVPADEVISCAEVACATPMTKVEVAINRVKVLARIAGHDHSTYRCGSSFEAANDSVAASRADKIGIGSRLGRDSSPGIGTRLTRPTGADFEPATLHDWPTVSDELITRALALINSPVGRGGRLVTVPPR